MSEYRPTFNRVIVELVDEEQSGVIVQRENQLYSLAKIVALGQVAGYRNEIKLQDFSIGQKIIVNKTGLVRVNTVNHDFWMCNDDNVLTILPD